MPTGVYKKKFKDLTGIKFGKLTVIKFEGREKRFLMWLCKCDCGNEKIIRGTSLTCVKNPTLSCGCNHIGRGNIIHSSSKTRLYNIWRNMKTRCYDTKATFYKRYGKRGITICDEWKENFKTFKKWSLENGYSDNLEIDRIDNNGNYEPSNCKWATRKEQNNNKSNNHFVEINGETKTLKQWCEYKKIPYVTVTTRIHRGMDDKKAILTPVRRYTVKYDDIEG